MPLSGDAWTEVVNKERSAWLCRYASESGLTVQNSKEALPLRTGDKPYTTRLPSAGVSVVSAPFGFGVSYTTKPNQRVPPTDGSLSPKPSRDTRGLPPSQAHAVSGESPLSFGRDGQSHPADVSRTDGRPTLLWGDDHPLQTSGRAGKNPGAPDARARKAMPRTDVQRMDELGATSPQFRSKRRAMVPNRNTAGGVQYMWPQDITGGRSR